MDNRITHIIDPLKSIKKSLAFKLIIWIGLILVIFLELACYLDLKSHSRLLVNQMEDEAYRLSDIIKRSTYHDMMLARRSEIQEVIENISAQGDVKKVRIIERGQIKITSHREELNKTVDKQAEACYDCHKKEGEKPLTVTRYRFFRTESGERVLGFVNPLYNDKDCQTCHGTERKVLGVLDIVLSMEKVYKGIKAHQRTSLMFIAACFLLLAISIGISIMLFVNKPIKQLMDGTHRITNGDLDYRLPIHTEDELGALGASFNQMTEKLKKSIHEIETWNHELADRVKEKTAELEKINHELAIANQKLSLSDKKKSEVVMLVAHDIRAPLAAVKSCLKVVFDGYLKNNREKEMEMIARAIERVDSQLIFVKNLLDFTRMEEEHREMSLLSLKPVIKNTVDIMQTWADEKHIRIEIRNLPEISLTGDEDLLNRSLTNLISNAIKYNPPQTIIWVDCQRREGQIEIQVGDNGVGIPEDELPEIFDILFRGAHAKRNHEGGAGLGLTIVKRAIELHNGSIRVESTLGKGTTFFITLPLLRDTDIEEIVEECALAQADIKK